MTTMDENMSWIKPTHVESTFSLNLRAPFCTFTFTSKLFIAFLKHTLEKIVHVPLCILHTLIPQIIPFLNSHSFVHYMKTLPPGFY